MYVITTGHYYSTIGQISVSKSLLHKDKDTYNKDVHIVFGFSATFTSSLSLGCPRY